MVPSMKHQWPIDGPLQKGRRTIDGSSMGMRWSIDGPWMGCPGRPTRECTNGSCKVQSLHGTFENLKHLTFFTYIQDLKNKLGMKRLLQIFSLGNFCEKNNMICRFVHADESIQKLFHVCKKLKSSKNFEVLTSINLY